MITRPRLSMPAAAGQPVRDRAQRGRHGSPAGYAGKRGAFEVRSSARTVPSSQRCSGLGVTAASQGPCQPAGRRGQPSCASAAVGLFADPDSPVSLAFPGRFGCQDRAGWLSPKRMAAWPANVGILRPGRSPPYRAPASLPHTAHGRRRPPARHGTSPLPGRDPRGMGPKDSHLDKQRCWRCRNKPLTQMRVAANLSSILTCRQHTGQDDRTAR
jgi:hypothetical protein